MDKRKAIVFYEASENDVRGIMIHREGGDVLQILRERFGGSYKSIVEWIEDGVSGGGYLTAEDISTFRNPGDNFTEPYKALTKIDLAFSDADHFYKINKNGTITEVKPLINVEFVKI